MNVSKQSSLQRMKKMFCDDLFGLALIPPPLCSPVQLEDHSEF